MTTLTKLMTRGELARFFDVSTRTLDRWRAMGVDLGEYRAHPRAVPRFDSEKVRRAAQGEGSHPPKGRVSRPAPVRPFRIAG